MPVIARQKWPNWGGPVESVDAATKRNGGRVVVFVILAVRTT